MNNQIISVIQSKGGAGKTTLLISIATSMAKDGAKIAIVEADPQKNTYDFCKKNKSFNFDYIFLEDANKVNSSIIKLKKIGYDAIFFDTAGFDSSLVTFIAANSDLVLIPSKANKDDAIGAVKTYSMVQSTATNMAKTINSYVVMMDIDKGTNITRKIVKEIEKAKIPLLKTLVGHSTGFKELTTEGVVAARGATKNNIESLLCELQMNKLLDFYITKLKRVG